MSEEQENKVSSSVSAILYDKDGKVKEVRGEASKENRISQ
jgi:hypothetical protein